jgi:hypothetical protein
MTAKWEYLVVIWSRFATKKTRPKRSDPTLSYSFPRQPSGSESYWLQEIRLSIRRPGPSKEENFILWSSEDGEKNSLLDIYNKLGAEGWEMVSVTPSAMTMQDEVDGYPHSSNALTVGYWFKRSI